MCIFEIAWKLKPLEKKCICMFWWNGNGIRLYSWRSLRQYFINKCYGWIFSSSAFHKHDERSVGKIKKTTPILLCPPPCLYIFSRANACQLSYLKKHLICKFHTSGAKWNSNRRYWSTVKPNTRKTAPHQVCANFTAEYNNNTRWNMDAIRIHYFYFVPICIRYFGFIIKDTLSLLK